MRSLDIPPSPALRPYVQTYWSLELDTAGELGPPQRIAPDGVVELVFHYGEPMATRLAGDGFAAQPRSSLVTLTRRWVEIAPRGATGLLSVRFRPWGACHFLAVPVSELADRVVPADELWGGAARELEERLATASEVRERVSRVEAFLLARLERDRRPDVEPLVRAVWGRGADVRVRDLCRDLGIGERTLERTFAATLGMTPRAFLRLSRFLAACATLRRGGWASLTRVGQDCGYYDQSHFIADFHALAGMTPGELLDQPSFAFLEPGG